MVYKFQPPIYDADPDDVKQELLALETEEGILDPKSIVNKARSPKSAMHKMFEWDDTEAAERYRIIQAQNILRVFVVVNNIKREDGHVVEVPNRVYEKAPTGYKQVVAIAQSPDEWAYLIGEARNDITEARNKLVRLEMLKNSTAIKRARASLDSAIASMKKAG